VFTRAGNRLSAKENPMTVNELIAALREWRKDLGDREVVVTTLDAETDHDCEPLPENATVLSVAVGPADRVVLVVG
jgi:hypothetical protein